MGKLPIKDPNDIRIKDCMLKKNLNKWNFK